VTATWTGGTDSNWATNTDWSGNIAPGSNSSTTNTDTALFNNAGNGNTAITVDASRNLQNIVFDTSSAAYSFSGGSLLGTSGGEILINPTVGSSETFNTPLTIEGSVFNLVNNASNPSATLNYSGTISAGTTSNATIDLGGSNTGLNTLSGSIQSGTKNTNVVETGTGNWVINGNDTFTGYTFVLGGKLQLPGTFAGYYGLNNDSGVLQITGTIAKAAVVTSYGGSTTLSGNGQLSVGELLIEDGGTATINNSGTLINNRISAGGISLAGGTLNYLSGTGNNSEQLTSQYLDEGANVLNIQPNGGGSSTIGSSAMYRNTVSNRVNGTLLLTGAGFGATPGAGVSTFVAGTSGTGWNQFGGGGAAGSTNVSVVPFVLIQDSTQAGNAQYGLVTGLGASNGLRLLSASEYSSSIVDGADTAATLRNVNLTGNSTVNGSATTVNAVRLDSGGQVSGSATLTVNSGEILALPGNKGIATNLNFGSQEAVFQTLGNLTVSGNVTGSGGLTKTGQGTLFLSRAGSLSYSGKTAVNQGTIRFGAANQVSPSASFLLNGGSIDLNGFSQTLAVASGLYAGAGSSIVNSSSTAATLTIGIPSTSPINAFRGTIGAPGGNNLSINVNATSGIIQLSHACTYSGSTTITSGALGLDFSQVDSALNNILPASTTVWCGGEIVAYEGSNPASQTVAGVEMTPGPDAIIETNASSPSNGEYYLPSAPLQLNLGALTRSIGALAVLGPGPNGGAFITSTPNSNGILGGWAVYNAQDWAVSNGPSDITPYSNYTNDTWSAGANVTVTTNSTQTNATANSLRFAGVTADTLTLSGTNTLTSGGVLLSYSAGNVVDKIQGGTLVGAPGADLVAYVSNSSTGSSAKGLEIDSVIANNGGATALTISGGGNLILIGNNTYTGETYIDYGTLKISSNANLGSPAAAAPVYLGFSSSTLAISGSMALDNAGQNPRPIVVGGFGGSIDVAPSSTVTIDGVISGSPLGTLKITDSGTLVISNPNNSFAGNLTAGSLILGSSTAAKNMTVSANLMFATGTSYYYIGGLAGGYSLYLFDLKGNPVSISVGSNNQNTTFYGFLNPYGFLDKTGTGTTTLAGQINSSLYSNVTNGALALTSSAALPAGSTLYNSASLILSTASTGANISVTGVGTTTINPGGALVAATLNQSGLVNNGSLQVTGTSTLGSMTGIGTLAIGSSTTSVSASLALAQNSGLATVGSLAIYAGSHLDLSNNHLIISYGTGADPIASIAAWIASGFNGGAWNGAGIDSSAAAGNSLSYGIGYADSADPNNPAGLASGTIEIKYTLLGDANLDGKVNGADFAILASNFNKSVAGVSGWDQGDFNYDGKINGADFALLAGNFNKGASGSAVAGDVAAMDTFAEANGLMADVPEPAGGMLGGVALVGLWRRRRKAAGLQGTDRG
jgi:fibronectin-binding autotransporter adhesin